MAKALDDDALKDKFARWRTRFVGIVSDAAKQNLDVGAAKKEKLEKLFGEVERAGQSTKGFKDAMTFLDHVDKAKGKREDVVGTEDEERLIAFDRFLVVDASGLPLFDAATKSEIKRSAAKAKEEAEPESPADDKVVPIKSAAEAAAATL